MTSLKPCRRAYRGEEPVPELVLGVLGLPAVPVHFLIQSGSAAPRTKVREPREDLEDRIANRARRPRDEGSQKSLFAPMVLPLPEGLPTIGRVPVLKPVKPDEEMSARGNPPGERTKSFGARVGDHQDALAIDQVKGLPREGQIVQRRDHKMHLRLPPECLATRQDREVEIDSEGLLRAGALAKGLGLHASATPGVQHSPRAVLRRRLGNPAQPDLAIQVHELLRRVRERKLVFCREIPLVGEGLLHGSLAGARIGVRHRVAGELSERGRVLPSEPIVELRAEAQQNRRVRLNRILDLAGITKQDARLDGHFSPPDSLSVNVFSPNSPRQVGQRSSSIASIRMVGHPSGRMPNGRRARRRKASLRGLRGHNRPVGGSAIELPWPLLLARHAHAGEGGAEHALVRGRRLGVHDLQARRLEPLDYLVVAVPVRVAGREPVAQVVLGAGAKPLILVAGEPGAGAGARFP